MTDSSVNTFPTRERIRAPRGVALTCKGWQQEAALRMFLNSLDPEVAEHAAETGYEAIVVALRSLENDQTLVLQSGKLAGTFRTQEHAPRVLMVDTQNWMYAGMQGILARSFEIFSAAARKHFGGNLAGKLVVSGGMGEMGGAHALAAALNGAAFLGIDVDPERIKRRVKAGYCDVMVNDLDESLRILKNAVRRREAASVGLVGNCADLIPRLAERGIVPDLLTDQTSAYDPINGYVPRGLDVRGAADLRQHDPDEYRRRSLDSVVAQVRAMLELQKLGAITFDSGNGIRAVAFEHGVKDAFEIHASAQDYIRQSLCEGRTPLEWVALSGESSDIRRAEQLALEIFPENENLARWIRLVQKRVRFQGLPGRAGWFSYGEHARFGLALNDLAARGELKAPMAIVCDYGEWNATPAHMKSEPRNDSKDSNSEGGVDWSSLIASITAASGATWVSIPDHANAGTGSEHDGRQGVVADGTPEMATRIGRTLTNYSTWNIIRFAAAGYPAALEFAKKAGITIPNT